MLSSTKRKLKAVLIMQVLLLNLNAQSIITTVAGTGIAGYNGDNILATNAELNNPSSIVFDRIGNLYISDVNNNRVRKINNAHIITTIAGNGIWRYSGVGTN